MIKKIAAAVALALAATCNIHAQYNAGQAFIDAPREVFPLVNTMTRMDMIDYFESGSQTPSNNVLEGKSRITEMSPTMLKADLSSVSSYTLALLPAGSDTIIAVIQTLSVPFADSSIQFYDEQWDELTKKKPFTSPTLADWLLPTAKGHEKDIENVIDFIPAAYVMDSNGHLTLTHSLKDMLVEDDYDIVKEYIRPSLSYQWKGGKMVMLK
ncbi:MAG: DUF3256 family protein [Bacteroidales bacterium]|nr:DUF3256 family protein [Bacteroidales bacterium]MCD8394097.1 DUF3256 family protein [Bacteroidales bacterium]